MTFFILQFRGELAALSAALIWAIASLIYIGLGKRMPPLALNLSKCSISVVLLVLTLVLRGELFPSVPATSIGLLLLSGMVGIGFGDTAFFEALNAIGARRSLLLDALSPPLAAFLAFVLLGERLSIAAWSGIALTVAGVAWVVIERTADSVSDHRHLWRGIGFGLLAALGQASGAVMSRAALVGTDISPLWSTLVRLLAGVIVLAIWVALRRQSWVGLQPLRSPRFLGILTAAAFFSTYLAIWLQQTALKYTATGIAQALSATSPLFVIPFAIWLGERVSLRAIIGVMIALGGVWLLFDLG